MHIKVKFSSVRLAIVLFICSFAVLLMQNTIKVEKLSFLSALAGTVLGVLFILLCFMPSAILKSYNNTDFISFANKATPSFIIFICTYYAIYFAYLISAFLLNYTDLFSKTLNPEANIYAVALIILSVCVYSATKGINILSRAALFVLAFSFIAFILIMVGNIAAFDFKANKIGFDFSKNEILQGCMIFSSIAFIAVIFAFTSADLQQYKLKHTALLLVLLTSTALVILLFIYCVLGNYSKMQPYPMYILSKASHMGVISGLDSLFLALSTSSVFVLISSLLICTQNCFDKTIAVKRKNLLLILFSLSVFILFISAQQFNSIKEIITNVTLMNIMNIISSLVIPVIYLIIFRRRLND